MSVGFGFSVGDFLAGLELVGTVIDALRESGASGRNFRALINELSALETALFQVKRLDLDDKLQIELLALHQAAAQCQQSIDQLWKKIQPYQPHLGPGTGSRIADGWYKVKWAICEKDDLANFRAEVQGHTSSIQILILTLQERHRQLEARHNAAQQEGLASLVQNFSLQTMAKLNNIERVSSQSDQQIMSLLDVSRHIMESNLKVFQMLHDMQILVRQIPGQIQRQQPILFTDPFNRVTPFHMEFVRSRDAWLSVLKYNFRDVGVGTELLDRGEFVIEDEGTSKALDLSRPWDACFFPGQKVAMSMVFKAPASAVAHGCPHCHEKNQRHVGDLITCTHCGIVYRRLQELVDLNFLTIPVRAPKLEPVSSTIGASLPEVQLSTGPRSSSTTFMISSFRRVQIIAQTVIRPPNSHPTKVYVGNISQFTTEEGLKEAFSQCGFIASAVVVKYQETGINKGFGYVDFLHESDTDMAVHQMNNVLLDGQVLRVDFAARSAADTGTKYEMEGIEHDDTMDLLMRLTYRSRAWTCCHCSGTNHDDHSSCYTCHHIQCTYCI